MFVALSMKQNRENHKNCIYLYTTISNSYGQTLKMILPTRTIHHAILIYNPCVKRIEVLKNGKEKL